MANSFNLKNIVPWGRTLEEYSRMFQLSEADFPKKFIDCGGGPSSFNAEMTQNKRFVTSCDPIYQFSRMEIQTRIHETYDQVYEQTVQNKKNFIWNTIANPEDLGQKRMSAMNDFLEDFEQGKKEGRYIAESLPHLPFQDNTFDLALSSHFLFLYTDILSLDFHTKAIQEMLRVAKEVRIFPLLNLNNQKSPYVDEIIRSFNSQYQSKILPVDYEFQKGANEVLKITKRDL